MDKTGSRRLLIFGIVTAAVILLILWKYLSIMVFHGSSVYDAIANKPVVERGPILDRNGRILAIQNRLDSVEAWIPYVSDPDETSKLLAEILSVDYTALRSDFGVKNASMWIKRKISPAESERIRALQSEGKLKGIYLRQELARTYPEKSLAAHLIGYTGVDNRGLDGIEYSLDSVLSPEAEGAESGTGVVYGNQVFLTIDINLQYFAEKLAGEAYEKYQADVVMLLAMDARTGEILAAAAKPSFDPNSFASYSEAERSNILVTRSYEPGSAFKVFTISALLDLGGISLDSRFTCNGTYDHVKPPIKCLGFHGDLTTAGIIKYSCNAGAAYASESADISSFYNMLRNFGFGSTTLLPFPGETAGILTDPSAWSNRSKPTIAFGQEVSVSAVQMLAAATVLTNGGILLKPRIVRKVVSPQGTVLQEYGREPIRDVISSRTAADMLLMMETATGQDGTATRAAVKGVRVSAKTGTGQMIDPKTGVYSETAFLASCLSILPTEDPRVIVYAVIDNPKGRETLGGRIAAPLAAAFSEEIVTYLGIPRDTDIIVEHRGTVRIQRRLLPEIGETLPDFRGYAKREILPLFSDTRIQLRIKGEGWVVRQDPEPGVPLTAGMTVTLELE